LIAKLTAVSCIAWLDLGVVIWLRFEQKTAGRTRPIPRRNAQVNPKTSERPKDSGATTTTARAGHEVVRTTRKDRPYNDRDQKNAAVPRTEHGNGASDGGSPAKQCGAAKMVIKVIADRHERFKA
jgi:hypothetical protein